MAVDLKALAREQVALERAQEALRERLGALEGRRDGDDGALRVLRRDVAATKAKFPQNALSDVIERHLHKKVARLNVGRPTEKTISSGLVGMTRSEHTIDTESDAASDNLASIRGGRAGDFLLISPENDARTIVVQHNNTGEGTAGNRIFLDGAADLSMDAIGHFLLLAYKTTLDSGNGGWQEITRSNRGGYSELDRCNSTLTLTTSNQDVANCSVTLPTIGTYLIIATFHFFVSSAGSAGDDFVGVLTNSSDAEQDSTQASISDLMVSISEGIAVTQTWRITTTANDEVYKLRARRSGATGTFQVLADLTTILAFSIPGGGGIGHAESHTVVSHSDTGATGAELNTLTGGSEADALHHHTLDALLTTAPTAKAIVSDNFTLDANSASYIVSAQTGSADDIDGITTFTEGQFVLLRAASGHTITLKDENAGASAGNRVRLPGGRDVSFTDDEVVYLYHDDTLNRWVLISGPPPVDEAGIEFMIDGGGSVITTGIKGWLAAPFACTIKAVRLLADQSGAIKVDIWKDTYANYPPTDADSITASAVPEIAASGLKDEDTTLTGWTTAVAKGDILYYNVDSVTTIERCLVVLEVDKT